MTEPTSRLPGDMPAASAVARMIRVDHAGEYGAVRIYQGQLAALRRSDKADLLRHMLAQEQVHLATFNRLVADRRVRPTALLPVWHLAGFALGALTASLGRSEPELRATISQFRAEELEHRDTGLAHGAEQAPAYRLLSAVIKTGCRAAIALSERI